MRYMRYLRGKIGVIALSVLLPLSVASFAGADSDSYKFILGYVGIDNGSTLVVNEEISVKITDETKFYNDKGKEISAHSLKGHKWIYAEGTINDDSSVDAEVIYLLPGFIAEKDMGKYPFIQTF